MKRSLIPFVIIALAITINSSGQTSPVILTFSAEYGGQRVPVDSILVKNLTKGTDTALFAPDTLLVLYSVPGIAEYPEPFGNGLTVHQNYPNPFKDQTKIRITILQKQLIHISISDVSGRVLLTYKNHLDKGNHIFTFSAGKENYYLFSVVGEQATASIKMISIGNPGEASCKISYTGCEVKAGSIKSIKATGNFGFKPGDTLRYSGYASTLLSVNGSDVIQDVPLENKTYIFKIAEGIPCSGMPTVTYEGQTYNTVQIGNQCWMKENLNVGKKIWGGLDQHDNDTIEKYCYNNDPLLCDVYGGLYQWAEAMDYTENQQVQGICPEGWHIPSISEWEILASYSGGPFSGGKHLKEAGNEHWNSMYNVTSDNSTGFTALPGGQFRHSEYFDYLGMYGNFWSSTKKEFPFRWLEVLTYEDSTVERLDGTYIYGYSVRCLSNSFSVPQVNTVFVEGISDTSAFSGGEVVDEGSAPVTARGVCWSTQYPPTISDAHTTDGIGPGSFSSYLQFLQPGTKYYYTAYATNLYGTSYGIIYDFTTLVVVLPEIYSVKEYNITDSSAICGGDLHDDGNGEIYERGICWGISPNPDIDGLHIPDTTQGMTFYIELTDLSPGTTYYFRAYARNKAGLSYGSNLPFITYSGLNNAIPCPGIPFVTYEGQTYNTVQVGDQCWLRENLNVGNMIQSDVIQTNNGIIEKYCYGHSDGKCAIFGGLYQWDEVMNYDSVEGVRGICPEGWHVPTRVEWETLSQFLGGNSVSGGKTKETSTENWKFPNTGATDSVGFTALPAGERLASEDYEMGWYVNLGQRTFLWTSTHASYGPYCWNLYFASLGSSPQTPDGPTSGYSVRCIKD